MERDYGLSLCLSCRPFVGRARECNKPTFFGLFPPPPASNNKAELLAMTRVGLIPITQSETIMRTTQQLSITLPLDMANVVKAKVRTGEYATESEVIRDGLRALLARDRAVES